MVSSNIAVVAGSCRFLPRPTGYQGFGPQSLRSPAFSTLGFPHDRWPLELAPPRSRRSPSTPRTAPPGPPRLDETAGVQGPGHLAAHSAGDGLAIKPYYLPVPPRRDRLLRGRSTGQNAHCTSPCSSHDAGSPHSTPCTAPPGPARPIRHGPVALRASPRFTTAHSGPPPGPAAGSSARGCSARGTSGAIDPGSLK